MVFPKQNLDVIDPGIGFSNPSGGVPLATGISFGGSVPVKKLAQIQTLSQVRSLIGYGPLAEAVALALQKRGGPINFIRHDVSGTPLADSVLNKTGPAGDGVIKVSGVPYHDFVLAIEIVSSGEAGVATFRFSLDYTADRATWSRTRIVPIGLSYPIPNSGLTLAFDDTAAISYTAGTLYTLSVECPIVGISDLADAYAVIPTSYLFYQWVVSGLQDTALNGSAIAAALAGHLSDLTNTDRYVRGFIDVGSSDTSDNVLDAAEDWTAARICPAYGKVDRVSALPYEGFGYRVGCSTVSGLAARALRELISTDLSRPASGPDDGVSKIYFDGYLDNRLDAAKISTMRTWPGKPGFYFANAKLKSAFGSDFTDLQYGRCMDVACRTTFEAQFPFTSNGYRTVLEMDASEEHPKGSLDPLDGADMDAACNGALSTALLEPNNVRGRPGHVTSVNYSIDYSWDVATTQQIKTSVGIVPLGYIKEINTDLYFTAG